MEYAKMPDFYVRRHLPDDFPYPYSIRFGGCEYSLTDEEWAEVVTAFKAVDSGQVKEYFSEDYKDIVIARSDDRPSLSSLIKSKPFDRRFL